MFRKRKPSEPQRAFQQAYTLSAKVLGSGAYAEVRLGQANDTGEPVAVKIIDKTDMKKNDLKKLNKEVRILKSLRHNNVVRVYDAFDEPTKFYIVMEYVTGGELVKKIIDDENPFTEDKSREIVRTIAEALKYCKDHGVIHRDIKPENILLTSEEEGMDIKIADFNLSKQIDVESVTFSVLETMCGTPRYVAPEVISGNPYSYKCDVWSLGVVTYLILSGGYFPFNPDTPGDKDSLFTNIREGRWRFRPEAAWSKVSPLAKDLLTKMIRRNPDARMGYEQLLAHPWFKSTDPAMKETINMRMMIKLNERRRMLAVKNVRKAVGILEEWLKEDADEQADDNKQTHRDASGLNALDVTFSGLA